MFFRFAVLTLLFLHSSEAGGKKKKDVAPGAPPEDPPKCTECKKGGIKNCVGYAETTLPYCKCVSADYQGDFEEALTETSYFIDCDYDECCRHKRKLTEQSHFSFAGNEDEYKEFVDACGEHDYKVSLYVGDTHFSGIAVPASDDIDAGCPSFVVAHVDFDEDGPATKELYGWHDKAEGMTHFPKESAPIGTFKAKDIARAFETAEPSGAGAYELLTNNCANFLINMANLLGVKIDSTITTYVTRRLLEDSGSALVDQIKESAFFLSHFEGRHLRGDIHDEELVQLVVDARATDIVA